VETWDAHDAYLEIWGDVSALGLAFWSPSHLAGYIVDPIVDAKHNFNIFFNEAITILAALEWAATLTPPPTCLAIHTDSSTSFGIFNSLHTLALYNPIILTAVKIHLHSHIDLHVFYIEGKKNSIADALSHHALPLAHHLAPGISIRFFMPPQVAMGVSLK